MPAKKYDLGKYLEYRPSDQKKNIAFDFEAIGALEAEIGSDVCTDGTGGARASMGPTNPVYITVAREVRSGAGEEKNVSARENYPIYKWVAIINSGSLKKQDIAVKEKNSKGIEGTLFTMKNAFPIKVIKSTDQRGVTGEEITFLAEGFEAGLDPVKFKK